MLTKEPPKGTLVYVTGLDARLTLGLLACSIQLGFVGVGPIPLLSCNVFGTDTPEAKRARIQEWEDDMLRHVVRRGGELWALKTGETWHPFTIALARRFRQLGGGMARGFEYGSLQGGYVTIDPPPVLTLTLPEPTPTRGDA